MHYHVQSTVKIDIISLCLLTSSSNISRSISKPMKNALQILKRNFTIFRDDEPSSPQDSSSFAAASTITVNKRRFDEIGSISSMKLEVLIHMLNPDLRY